MKRFPAAALMSCLLAGALLAPNAALAFRLTSSAFIDHGPLPSQFTCTGAGISPPLSWHGAPKGTRGFALILTDPDAPDPNHPPTHTYIHWVVAFLPAGTNHLAAHQSNDLPRGSREGVNSTGHTGFTPPCPPAGRHRYIFTLYALDTDAQLTQPSDTRAQVLQAIAPHVLAKTRLIGTYRHHSR